MNSDYKKAMFAGGCFWCTQSAFADKEGVIETTAGYTGGKIANPTYRAVCDGNTGHYEALEVTYDPSKITYKELLKIYWQSIDPTDYQGQFHDRGSQYQTAIFYYDSEQMHLAESSKVQVAKLLQTLVRTEILPVSTFYPAEDYHQDYHKTNSLHYKSYCYFSGRDARLKELWSDVGKQL